MKNFLSVAAIILAAQQGLSAQALTGTKTVGGTSPDYPTLVAAANAVVASGVGAGGVTFVIRSGTYDGAVNLSGSSNSNPIVFEAEAGATVVVTCSTGIFTPVFTLSGSWPVTLRGLTIQAVNQDAVYSSGSGNLVNSFFSNTITLTPTSFTCRGIYGQSGNNLLVEGNEITINVTSGTSNNCRGVVGTGFEEGSVIRGNMITLNATVGTGHAAIGSIGSPDLIERNVVRGIGSNAAIGIDLNNNLLAVRTVRNNVVTGCNRAINVTTALADIENNTFHRSGGTADLGHIETSDCTTNWRNNIFFHGGTGGYCIFDQGGPGGGLSGDYNLFFAPSGASIGYSGAARVTLADWRAASSADANSLHANPSFVDLTPGAEDLHIQYGSPAREAGTTIAGVSVDLDGQARPSGSAYDIGADENSDPAPPAGGGGGGGGSCGGLGLEAVLLLGIWKGLRRVARPDGRG